jgi:predicted flap endonuclease-1-like 5' DNA nuclease
MTNTQTSASGLSLLPEGTATITTLHLAIIAVLAVLAIIGILWGIRQKRTRVQATRELVEHAEEAGVPPEPVREPALQTQSQVQVSAPPVAPAPPPVAPAPQPIAPPIADEPVLATPEPIADEPIAASFDASPATELAPPAPVPATTYADELVTQLKGLGPKVAARLAELGVTTIGQMAALNDTQAESIDAQLGAFTGRMGRDRWIEQARLLAAGDRAGFEAVFGKL